MTDIKSNLHSRNLHREGYHFEDLCKAVSELKAFVRPNVAGKPSIDFSNSEAVKLLNKALLKRYYDISEWDIPSKYLCPPIPGRADYIHYLADLLASDFKEEVPRGAHIRVLDIGVGSSCIYPILGRKSYGWSFVGTDIDPIAIGCAKWIANSNPDLKRYLSFRKQEQKGEGPISIFNGVFREDERFELMMCNPPFHSSQEAAQKENLKKVKKLNAKKGGKAFFKANGGKSSLNFGGQDSELWCVGGEKSFIKQIIKESVGYKDQCLWFTSLVSKKETLPALYRSLERAKALDVKTIEMGQGQKQSRVIAWSFIYKGQRRAWASKWWKG